MTHWLHNMSVAPRTVISQAAAPAQQTCRRVLFRLDAPVKTTRRQINACAAKLDLPPAAAVCASRGTPDDTCTDLLTCCVVLSKSSGAVYLRDKEPNLTRLVPGASVTLLIPKSHA